jgi:uncharacterized membrane protein YgdD (TMEM256/DUF423 family)
MTRQPASKTPDPFSDPQGQHDGWRLGPAAAGYVAGTVIFSGTPCLLAVGGPRWLGAVTPLGGLSFLFGWAWLAWSAVRR